MSYQDTVEWMFQQLPMYQNIGKSAFKKDLSNTVKLSSHLDNPEQNFKSVHVAGTNGKGSVSHMLASIFQTAGYKTGLYTSPHLKDFRERIKINGEVITEDYVVDFIENNKVFLENNSLSFFEMTVGMAFDYFSQEDVDIAIIEVGLGGRLDSTNIITPEVSVITNIGFDHMSMLGNTLDAIAYEKAGIIKKYIPVVIGETQSEIEPVFNQISSERNSDIYYADKLVKTQLKSDLEGKYQEKNIKTVLQTISILKNLGYHLPDDDVENGLLHVVGNTGLMGRWQTLQESPRVICDTAHNKEGLTYVVNQLAEQEYNQLHIVFGVVADKDLDSILPILPRHAKYFLCSPNIARGLAVNLLQAKFNHYGIDGAAYPSVNDALYAAKISAEKNDLIFVGGSTFVVAEVV
ncbi:dihydrofolate synthase / folylpolyglutamate synthase [Flavobacteriaceae bacterium MAR_2010_188]|nr:dihydrofolate synthase / folylpolyglutamate synthase [Flavobacteriaceae bacterium MAR_2010_188]